MRLGPLHWLLALGLLLPGAMPTALEASPPSESLDNSACLNAEGRAVIETLALHNEERGRLDLPPLAWSCRLAVEAAAWAQVLAARGRLDHAPGATRGGSGENLWMGTTNRFDIAHMIARFIDEKRHFRHARFPNVSTTGEWADVGHYSQMVWRDTREMGCALARGPAHDVLVCRYFPAGNVRGRVAY